MALIMDRKRLAKGLFEINGSVYVEFTVRRKLYRLKAPLQGSAAIDSKNRPTKRLAAWIKDMREAIYNERFEVVSEQKQRSSFASVDQLCEAYAHNAAVEYAKEGEPRPSTAIQNIATFKRIAKKIGATRTEELTTQAIETWLKNFCAGYSPDQADRARVSAWNQLAQARSLFTAWTAPYYQQSGVKLPKCLTDWPVRKRDHSPAYNRPPDDLRKATMEWYGKLEEVSGGLWICATLMLQFAMRPVDAAALTWANIEGPAGARVLRYIPSKTRGRTKSARVVTWPVGEALYQRMRKHGGAETVVPETTPSRRYDLFNRSLNPMIRGLGWPAEKYGKACYELRKMCVDAVYRKFGIERACQISGDNAATIMKFYADPNVSGLEPVDVSTLV